MDGYVSIEVFLATGVVLGLTALVGVWLVVRLLRTWRPSSVPHLTDEEETAERNPARLQQQVARQRALIGCLVVTLVVIIVLLVGGLLLGRMILQGLSGGGHPN